MTLDSNATSLIDVFLAQLPATVSLEQQGNVYGVQPQTMEALHTVLTRLTQPEWASIKIVQTAIDAETLETSNKLWLDTTTATAKIFNHKPQDFVVTVGTGKTLEAVEALLANTNQTLAFSPAFSDSATTLGVLLAKNTLPLEANIRRSTLNELVLGCAGFSPTTGECIAFGGEVVKNVTGYDVQKFLVGHHYALGVVSSITLRTTPLLPIKGVCQGVFSTEVDLFNCLETCLTQPSLWMTQLLVTPCKQGFSLSVGVEVPTLALLEVWQNFYFPTSQFTVKTTVDNKKDSLLAFEIALPLGRTTGYKILNYVLPLLTPDGWHWLPACGVLQVFYNQNPPTIALIQQAYKQVGIMGGSIRLLHAEASLNKFSVEIYHLQWERMAEAMQNQHHQLKQQLDPNHQFYSSLYPTPLEKI